MRAYPSLKDVAARAGVSYQTAGKVLGGGGTVSNDTRDRILKAARDIGYVANGVARSLANNATQTVGIVAGNLGDQVLADFVVGADLAARSMGHVTIISVPDSDGDGAAQTVELLIQRRVDGILFAAPQLEHCRELGSVLRGRVPMVSIHRLAVEGVALVGSDHYETATLVMQHLLSHGHQRIGMVAGPLSRDVSKVRSRAYQATLRSAGMSFAEDWVVVGQWDAESGRDAARELISRSPELTALYCHNDLMAIGAVRALYECGRRVPQDCAVVGCDDIDIGRLITPALTTVRVPSRETGVEAIKLLVRLMRGEAPPRRPLLLPVELVVRESCGCHWQPGERSPGGKFGNSCRTGPVLDGAGIGKRTYR